MRACDAIYGDARTLLGDVDEMRAGCLIERPWPPEESDSLLCS